MVRVRRDNRSASAIRILNHMVPEPFKPPPPIGPDAADACNMQEPSVILAYRRVVRPEPRVATVFVAGATFVGWAVIFMIIVWPLFYPRWGGSALTFLLYMGGPMYLIILLAVLPIGIPVYFFERHWSWELDSAGVSIYRKSKQIRQIRWNEIIDAEASVMGVSVYYSAAGKRGRVKRRGKRCSCERLAFLSRSSATAVRSAWLDHIVRKGPHLK